MEEGTEMVRGEARVKKNDVKDEKTMTTTILTGVEIRRAGICHAGSAGFFAWNPSDLGRNNSAAFL